MLSIRLPFSSKASPKPVLDALDRSLAIIKFAPDGTILSANPNFCQLVGYGEAEIVGRHHRMFVDPEYAKSAEYQAFWAKLRRGEFDRQEYPRIGKGGTRVWIQASYNPVMDARGRVIKIVKVASDTTAERLRNSAFEAKLAAIARVQGVIEFTPTGQIIDANANFLDLLGYRLEEIKGKHHSLFVEPAYARSAEYERFWQTLNGGAFVSGEFQRLGKGGRIVWIQASYNPIYALNGKVASIVKFATDITGRVRAVTELADGLAELAVGNLEHRLSQPFIPAFEQLRADYNASLQGLHGTMCRLAESAEMNNTASQEVAAATDDMSRRVERQASGLGQTAATLNQITATVRRSAEGALEAAVAASHARSGTIPVGRGHEPSRHRHGRDPRKFQQDQPDHRHHR